MRTRLINGKEYVFCEWRRKFVRLTPEEYVRQSFLMSLVQQFGYPKELIAVEQPIRVGEVQKRCDAVVYRKDMCAVCLIEFKAPSVALTQAVFDQAAVYNRTVGVRYVIISNLEQTYCLEVLPTGYHFLSEIPPYNSLQK